MARPRFAPMAPRSALASLLAIGIWLGLCGPPRASASDGDRWLGPDKALHFSFSAAISMGGYGVASVVTDDWRWRLLSGGVSGLAAGVGKEALDATGSGDASWKDLTWDAIGTATGLGLALLIDWLASPPTRHVVQDRDASP